MAASEYVDYETNTLKPDKDGQVEVKYGSNRRGGINRLTS